MVASSRLCLPACPPGHSTTWPPNPPLMGRVCTERSMLALVSGRDVSIIAGAAVGGAVCVGVVIGALLYMRRRAKPAPEHPPHDHRHPLPRLWPDRRPNATEVPVADEERAEFLRELAALRGEATNFLEMLSHTRNRFRTLGGPDSPTDTKAKAYRAVVRDLSRVLTLLNRKDEHILTVPGDWRRLLSWAARVLARYKRQKAAKEGGDLPSLEPLAASGGTLYQTRRQAQAERCRLVTMQGPGPWSCRDTTCSQLGSRCTSLMSLTPAILEEEEDEEEKNGETLFRDDLGTSPAQPFRTINDTVQDRYNDSNVKSLYQVQQSGVEFHVTNEEALMGDELIKETNNNITRETKRISQLSNKIRNPYQTSPTITEKLMNLKNIEHLLEARNEAKHIKQISNHREKSIKEAGGTFESQIEAKTSLAKPLHSSVDSGLPETDIINASVSGEDVYINIIRKPVMVGLMLAGDPYRDDTIDTSDKYGSRWADNKNNNNNNNNDNNNYTTPVVSCKVDVGRHIPVPRCELTTEL